MLKEQKRLELYGLLGELPPRDTAVSAKLLAKEERGNFVIEKLVLSLNGIEQVPAYFIRPKENRDKTPVILFNHSHGGNYHVGKDEVLNSASYMHQKSYAEELAACGYSILCIDAWGFGERRGRTEGEIFKEMLWKGQVMWGMMVYDSLKAVDYIFTRDDADVERIGTLGMSMGSTMAWWTAALDERIKVCVDICCMTDFQSLIESQGIELHGIYYYVPGLLKRFTAAQINSLISPRPHLSLNGIYDRLTPEKGLNIINEELKKAYQEDGAAECFELKKYPVSHLETMEMRAEAIRFLKKWL
ncbi:MAG: alpha/beta hydrolase family protein [Bacillota bacterium]